MPLPSVSVILPNYNHAPYLSQCLNAMLDQSVKPKEVIVIDDASTDNSVDVISEFAQQNSSIKLILNKKNMGVLTSNLKGFEQATGDYILFAAADDYLLPGIFELSLGLLTKYPQAGLCSSKSRRINENGDYLDSVPEPPYASKHPCYLPKEKMLNLMLKRDNWHIIVTTALFNRKMLIESKALDPAVGDYFDGFAVLLMAINYGACFIPQELGVHRVLKNSRSSAASSKPEIHLQEVSPMWKLMETTHADWFPPRFRKNLRGRHLYEYGAIACEQCKKSLEKRLEELKIPLDSQSVIDYLFCIGVRMAIKFQLFLIKAYLFFRLRKINIDVLMRKIYRRRNRTKE